MNRNTKIQEAIYNSIDRHQLKAAQAQGLLRDISVKDFTELEQQFISMLGKTRLSINFLELFTTLVYENIIQPFSIVTFFFMPPKFTVNIVDTITPGYISIVVEERPVIDQDHALSLTVIGDNKTIYSDADMVMDRYRQPINFFQLGAVYPIKNFVQDTIVNTSNSTVYFSTMDSGGRITIDDWTKIVVNYFKVIEEETGIRVEF